MAILTKTAVTKGTPANFSLNKTELSSLSSFSSNLYFSNTSNWKSVKLCYVSENKQREVVVFNAIETTPQSKFLVSEKADNSFQIRKIIVQDFDGGYYEIARNQLTQNDLEVFDVSLS